MYGLWLRTITMRNGMHCLGWPFILLFISHLLSLFYIVLKSLNNTTNILKQWLFYRYDNILHHYLFNLIYISMCVCVSVRERERERERRVWRSNTLVRKQSQKWLKFTIMACGHLSVWQQDLRGWRLLFHATLLFDTLKFEPVHVISNNVAFWHV